MDITYISCNTGNLSTRSFENWILGAFCSAAVEHLRTLLLETGFRALCNCARLSVYGTPRTPCYSLLCTENSGILLKGRSGLCKAVRSLSEAQLSPQYEMLSLAAKSSFPRLFPVLASKSRFDDLFIVMAKQPRVVSTGRSG